MYISGAAGDCNKGNGGREREREEKKKKKGLEK